MRKIESAMLYAVRARKNWKQGNTEVLRVDGIIYVLLHGNTICAIPESGRKGYTFAGWDTATTRSRLRALGAPIVSKNGERYANDVKIDTRHGQWFFVD